MCRIFKTGSEGPGGVHGAEEVGMVGGFGLKSQEKRKGSVKKESRR